MFFLSKIGVVSSSWYIRQWRWMVLFAFVLGAVVTPTFDPITQSLVAGPVIVLYATGTSLARFAERGRSEPEDEDEAGQDPEPAVADSPSGGSN